MAVGKPKAIKNYLAVLFAGIDGTGGYTNTVASVNEKAGNKAAAVSKGAAEVWLVIGPIDNLGGTHGTRTRRVSFKVTGQVVNPRDASDSDGAMLSLFDDLARAIESDSKAGGLCSLLTWSRMDPVVGDPGAECVFAVTAEYSEAKT